MAVSGVPSPSKSAVKEEPGHGSVVAVGDGAADGDGLTVGSTGGDAIPVGDPAGTSPGPAPRNAWARASVPPAVAATTAMVRPTIRTRRASPRPAPLPRVRSYPPRGSAG